MNGPLHRYEVYYQQLVEVRVEVEAETEHEAWTSITGPKAQLLYIHRIDEDADESQTEPGR